MKKWKYAQKMIAFIMIIAVLGSGLVASASEKALLQVYESLDYLRKIEVSTTTLEGVRLHQQEISELLEQMKKLTAEERDALTQEDNEQLAGYFVLLYALQGQDTKELEALFSAEQLEKSLARVEKADNEATPSLRFTTEGGQQAAPSSYVPVRLLCVLVGASALLVACMLLHRQWVAYRRRVAAIKEKRANQPGLPQQTDAPVPAVGRGNPRRSAPAHYTEQSGAGRLRHCEK